VPADVEIRAVLLEPRTLSGAFTTTDNVALQDADRVLVPNQLSSTENDI
jgi:hypothetical protein